MVEWPDWWQWELDLTLPHLQKRMVERRINEVELRAMLEDAIRCRKDHEPGRYAVETRHGGRPWKVIVARWWRTGSSW